jgi:hypothetical protein
MRLRIRHAYGLFLFFVSTLKIVEGRFSLMPDFIELINANDFEFVDNTGQEEEKHRHFYYRSRYRLRAIEWHI